MLTRTVALVVVTTLLLAGCAGLMQDSIESLIRQGIELFMAGQYDQAITKFVQVIQRDPRSWTAFLYLARSYVAKGAWGDAIASGRKALELAPNSAEVMTALADALLGAGTDALRRRQVSEAIGHLVEYVRLRPSDAQGYLNLGKAYLESGNVGGAMGAFRRVLELNPNDAEARRLLRPL
jgi:Flp pilus assembly protein TadD